MWLARNGIIQCVWKQISYKKDLRTLKLGWDWRGHCSGEPRTRPVYCVYQRPLVDSLSGTDGNVNSWTSSKQLRLRNLNWLSDTWNIHVCNGWWSFPHAAAAAAVWVWGVPRLPAGSGFGLQIHRRCVPPYLPCSCCVWVAIWHLFLFYNQLKFSRFAQRTHQICCYLEFRMDFITGYGWCECLSISKPRNPSIAVPYCK